MIKAIWTGAPVLVASLLFGCAGNTGPDEVGSSGLSLVRKADYEGQVRYIDEAVSDRPLTAAELGDTSSAIPVEVRFYDDWAVAWYALDGIAQTGDPANAVKVWRVEEHVPISNDDVVVGDDGESTTNEPAPGEQVTDVTVGTGFDDSIATPDIQAPEVAHLPFARLDWLHDVFEEWWHAQPPSYHPGCIE